jgi:hypothetical protein
MTDMLTMIKSMGLRWAADLDMPEVEPHDDIVIAGMGGSSGFSRWDYRKLEELLVEDEG